MKNSISQDYYTYTLAYPDNFPEVQLAGIVFYVGKGRNGRIYHHEDEARKGIQSEKCEVIRTIQSYGLQVVKKKEQENLSDKEALASEKDLIRFYGDTLTNVDRKGRASCKQKDELSPFGKLVDFACRQKASKHGLNRYPWEQLAKDAHIVKSALSKACRGKTTPSREYVLKICETLECEPELTDRICNTAGYASQRQQDEASQGFISSQEEIPGLSPDGIPLKKCTRCPNSYPNTSEYFHRNRNKLCPLCKQCANQRTRTHYREHPEYYETYKKSHQKQKIRR